MQEGPAAAAAGGERVSVFLDSLAEAGVAQAPFSRALSGVASSIGSASEGRSLDGDPGRGSPQRSGELWRRCCRGLRFYDPRV